MEATVKSKPKIVVRIGKFLLFLFGIGLVGYLGLSLLASYKEKQVDRAWAETQMSMADFQSKYLNGAENSALREMAKALEPLGLKSVYKKSLNDKSIEQITLDVGEISDDLAKLETGDEIRPVSEKGKAFLHRHAANLENLYTVILRNDPPRWKTVIMEDRQIVCPSYLGVSTLARMIVVDAMEKERLEKYQEALDALEAGLKISQGFSRHPDLVSCMIGVAIDGLFLEKVGHMKNVPHEWLQRNMKRDYRKNLLIVSQSMAWWISKIQIGDLLERSQNLGGSIPKIKFSDLPFLIKPYLRLCLADNSEVIRRMVVDLKKQGETGENSFQSPARLISWYNYLGGRWGIFSLESAWIRALSVMLLHEQAEKILQIKEMYYLDGNLPPPEKVTGLESAVIPGVAWEYIPGIDGVSFSLKLSKNPDQFRNMENNNFWLLPLDGKTFWKLRKPSRLMAIAGSTNKAQAPGPFHANEYQVERVLTSGDGFSNGQLFDLRMHPEDLPPPRFVVRTNGRVVFPVPAEKFDHF